MNDSVAALLFGRLPDSSARTALFEGYQPLAFHVAGRYAHRGAELVDLRQVAGIGLLNAIDRYDPRRGCRFTTFAVPTIAGEIKRYFRDNLWGTGVPRRLKDLKATCVWAGEGLTHTLGRTPTNAELAAYIGVPVDDIVEVARLANAYRPDSLDGAKVGHARPAGSRPNDADATRQFDEADAVGSAVLSLSPLQQAVLELRFSFEMTQSQIAEKIGVSQMQVSRLLRRTLETLRTRITRAA
ncbi:MAG TPA: sigma-70 family RNA polymerase sigma factor [Acidimicrobiia bacterium]|nr:sigma-70 family RNA polymerase sigma factor [Acidimicrobiia bacterium]